MLLLILLPLVSSQGLEFMSIGDWGDSGAKKIAGYMGKHNPEWILAVGDNFYDEGISGWDDPLVKEVYEDTFTAKSLQVPWYVCAGNHDYYGGDKGIQGEISYSKHSSRWKFPSFYYDQVLTHGDVTIHLISTDTWRINGGDTYVNFDPYTNRFSLKNISDIHYRYQMGFDDMDKGKHDVLVKNFKPDDPEDPVVPRADQEQLDWISKTLDQSEADWKIVTGHFPVHSCTTGEHGDTKSLKKLLEPILKSKGADIYFSGHDHILQHILVDGVHYLGSGAGARKHTGYNNKYAGLKGISQGHYGFMVHNATKTTLKTTFVIDNGKTPYNFTITK